MSYDSRQDTIAHIRNVSFYLLTFVRELFNRSDEHDKSKLVSPEKEVYDKYTPLLKETEYGSAKYQALLKGMDEGVKHHWANNRHHPEFFPNGIDGMNLIDVMEMLADWKAASERHATGNIRKSIEINIERFKISDQLKAILLNTIEYMGW